MSNFKKLEQLINSPGTYKEVGPRGEEVPEPSIVKIDKRFQHKNILCHLVFESKRALILVTESRQIVEDHFSTIVP